MKRIVALLVVIAAAGFFAWLVAQGRDPSGAEACAAVETRLKAGDFEGAQRAADEARKNAPHHISRYLDALLEFSIANRLELDKKPEEAAQHDARAVAAAEEAYADGPVAQDDWRIVSMVVFTRIQGGRLQGAWDVLDRYLQKHPLDERALAAAAEYWTRNRKDAPDPTRAIEYLDRIDALKARTAPEGDPTALTKDLVARLRAMAEDMRGRTAAALAAAEDRVQAAESDAAAWAALGEARRKAQKPTEAIAAYRRAVELDPASDAYARNLCALLFDDPDAADELMTLTEAVVKRQPGDAQAHILRARALVRYQDMMTARAQAAGKPDEPGARDGYAEAIEIYKAILLHKPDVPPEIERDVSRNVAIALYDWKQGGRKGAYLDEAYLLLLRYQKLGGVIDGRLQDVWEKLATLYAAKHPGPR